ncbi:MAG: hypothetical protein ACRD44_04975, partial [Bryobacteraceae bacterium]
VWTLARMSLQGITYARSEKLPPEYRNALYVAGHPGGEIYRIRLRREGSTFRGEATTIASVPQALDITVDEGGVFYISCYQMNKIYRLRRQRP